MGSIFGYNTIVDRNGNFIKVPAIDYEAIGNYITGSNSNFSKTGVPNYMMGTPVMMNATVGKSNRENKVLQQSNPQKTTSQSGTKIDLSTVKGRKELQTRLGFTGKEVDGKIGTNTLIKMHDKGLDISADNVIKNSVFSSSSKPPVGGSSIDGSQSKVKLVPLDLSKYDLANIDEVKRMQKDLGLKGADIDGVIGKNTLGRLAKSGTISNYNEKDYLAGLKDFKARGDLRGIDYTTPEDKYVYGPDHKVTDAYFNGAEKQFYNLHNQDTIKNTEVANPGSNAKLDALGKLYDDKKITREAYNHAANAILNPNQNSTPAQTAPQGWFDQVSNWFTRERTPEEKAAMNEQVRKATGYDMGTGLSGRFSNGVD